MNGWTQELTEAERATNEVNICLEMVEEQPLNEYWQNRLAAALVHEHELLNPLTLSECIEAAFMLCPDPNRKTWEFPYSLNDMSLEEQAKLFKGVQPIEF